MNLTCQRCQREFDHPIPRGYCTDCLAHFAGVRDVIDQHRNPMPGVHLDGKFAAVKECPQTMQCPVTDKEICGLCGSDELEPSYGVGSGYGVCGSYVFCCECNHFLNFIEDADEE